jgi:hypothetical protein
VRILRCRQDGEAANILLYSVIHPISQLQLPHRRRHQAHSSRSMPVQCSRCRSAAPSQPVDGTSRVSWPMRLRSLPHHPGHCRTCPGDKRRVHWALPMVSSRTGGRHPHHSDAASWVSGKRRVGAESPHVVSRQVLGSAVFCLSLAPAGRMVSCLLDCLVSRPSSHCTRMITLRRNETTSRPWCSLPVQAQRLVLPPVQGS